MTKEELVETLWRIVRAAESSKDGRGNPELDHERADDALIAYINDPMVTDLYERLEKWYG